MHGVKVPPLALVILKPSIWSFRTVGGLKEFCSDENGACKYETGLGDRIWNTGLSLKDTKDCHELKIIFGHLNQAVFALEIRKPRLTEELPKV